MRKLFLNVAWVSYIVALAFVAFAFFPQEEFDYIALLNGGSMMLVPWVICLLHAIKYKHKVSSLWFYSIVFFGTVAIPIHLYYASTQRLYS